jgi:hypothetical protein
MLRNVPSKSEFRAKITNVAFARRVVVDSCDEFRVLAGWHLSGTSYWLLLGWPRNRDTMVDNKVARLYSR